MRLLTAILTAALFAPSPVPAMAPRPAFFRVVADGGKWWFIDPAGKKFLSIGVDMVNHGAAPGKWSPDNPNYSALRSYPSEKAWEDDTLARLTRWGFNTIAAWSDEDIYRRDQMPFAICMHLGSSAGIPWVDLWDPELEKSLNGWAREWTEKWKGDRQLIGYFYDNENGWWDETLVNYFMGMPWREQVDEGEKPAWKYNRTKMKLVEIMEKQYGGDIGRFREDWMVPPFRIFTEDGKDGKKVDRKVPQKVEKLADLREPVQIRRKLGRRPAVIDLFMEALYDRYGELMHHAMKGADPNHLLLGERFHQMFTPQAARACGKWNDVVSTNLGVWTLDGWVSPNWVASMGKLSGRPVLVGEYYFSAMENTTGCRNSNGGFPTVQTQKERAAGYSAQVRQMASMPAMVGWHWFQYFDEPPKGRGDGEDYNMGLVDISNREYPEMVAASIAVNGEAMALHERAQPLPEQRPGIAPSFRVPAAAKPPAIDGAMLDWDKPAAWLPQTGGEPFNAPLGDFFVSTTPGRLHVALMYQYAYKDPTAAEELPRGASWPAGECERLTLVLAKPNGEKIMDLRLRDEPDGKGWKLEPGTSAEGVEFSRKGRLEISIPIPAVKELKFAAELRSWGDTQVIYWGARPLHESPDPAGWGTLILPGSASAR